MIDEFTKGSTADIKSEAQLEAEEQGLIRLHDATFFWGTEGGSKSPRFGLRIPDLTFVKGKINLITGATGSGKSTLLKVSNVRGEADFRLSRVSFTLKSVQARSSTCLEKVV
jgi:energy-coupling factor transporter ATP-binding protein EcfA2